MCHTIIYIRSWLIICLCFITSAKWFKQQTSTNISFIIDTAVFITLFFNYSFSIFILTIHKSSIFITCIIYCSHCNTPWLIVIYFSPIVIVDTFFIIKALIPTLFFWELIMLRDNIWSILITEPVMSVKKILCGICPTSNNCTALVKLKVLSAPVSIHGKNLPYNSNNK